MPLFRRELSPSIFASPAMKQLPKKLRQLLSEREQKVLKQGSTYGFGQAVPRKKLRSPHKEITLDTLAHEHRSRPTSAVGKRRKPTVKMEIGPEGEGGSEKQGVEEERVLSRRETAPVMLHTETTTTTTTNSCSETTPGQLASIPSNTGRGVLQLQRNISAPMLSQNMATLQILTSPNNRRSSVRLKSPSLTRRRSSSASPNFGSSGKQARRQKVREAARREERRLTNEKLRATVGAMLHRQLISGWHSWIKFVKAHRYRNLQSAALSVLNHVEPGQRNTSQIEQVVKWMRSVRLECLRPLVEGYNFNTVSNNNVNQGGDNGGEESTSLLTKLCRRCIMKRYNKGDVMFWQTEFGDHYQIVISGLVGIYATPERGVAAKLSEDMKKMTADGHKTPDWSLPAMNRKLGRWICNFNVGTGFGELALTSWDRERKATAMAAEDNTCVLLVDRAAYKTCLWHLHQADQNLDERVAWLQKTDHFGQWNKHRLAQFAYSLTEKIYHRGDVIFEEGDQVNHLVLLHTGMCQGYLRKRNSGTSKVEKNGNGDGGNGGGGGSSGNSSNSNNSSSNSSNTSNNNTKTNKDNSNKPGTGGHKEIPLALYEPGTFLGQTDLVVSASRQKSEKMSVRALSSSDVKVYCIPKESYIKFVLKNTDAATSKLKRRLIDLSEARGRQIVSALKRSEVAEKMARTMSPIRQTMVCDCFLFH